MDHARRVLNHSVGKCFVRYAPADGKLWVEFSDGLVGVLELPELVGEDLVLRPETAVVAEDLDAVELLDEAGEIFHIDAGAARATIDSEFARHTLQPEVARTQRSLGQTLRQARSDRGITQPNSRPPLAWSKP